MSLSDPLDKWLTRPQSVLDVRDWQTGRTTVPPWPRPSHDRVSCPAGRPGQRRQSRDPARLEHSRSGGDQAVEARRLFGPAADVVVRMGGALGWFLAPCCRAPRRRPLRCTTDPGGRARVRIGHPAVVVPPPCIWSSLAGGGDHLCRPGAVHRRFGVEQRRDDGVPPRVVVGVGRARRHRTAHGGGGTVGDTDEEGCALRHGDGHGVGVGGGLHQVDDRHTGPGRLLRHVRSLAGVRRDRRRHRRQRGHAGSGAPGAHFTSRRPS